MTTLHDVLASFGYPQNLIKEYNNWILVLRAKQVTIGSMILACKDDATSFGDISAESMAELKTIVQELESVLRATFDADKFNYLMFMMVDPYVHFHVIPRYNGERIFKDTAFTDAGWPKTPNMDAVNTVDDATFAALTDTLRTAFGK